MSTPIDPSTISSWEDAFQHPIPQVRQLERQLRTDLAINKEKLRGLVGESYRDLLQTAERIVDMDAAAKNVETNLGDASRNCNSKLLDRKAKNLKIFNDTIDKRDREKYTVATQLSVLQACPSVISRLLHKDQGESCLLAAKVFVIYRLLLKSLSEKSSIPLLTTLRSQFNTLRPILLQHIDTLLSSITLSTPLLVSTLTAFSLLKTSPPSEVLRHLLHIRSTALSSLFDTGAEDVMQQSILLFNKTLVDADSIFPNSLSNALLALKSKSLLLDHEVAALPELSLDVHSRWLPEDIRGFIPWVRHDDLEFSRVKELVRTWAEKEISKLNTSLETYLAKISDISVIMTLRSGLLSTWRSGLSIRRKFLPDPTGGETLRPLLMARACAISRNTVSSLSNVTTTISDLLSTVSSEAPDSTSLWLSPLPADLTLFRTAVSNRVHGKSPTVLTFLSIYNSWLSRISTLRSTFTELRTPTSLDDEDFDAEEERTQAGLEDSVLADKELSISLDAAYRQLDSTLTDLLNSMPLSSPQAVFLLRTCRQIRTAPPIAISWFGTDSIPRLHGMIAMFTMMSPLQEISRQLKERGWDKEVPGKPLWEDGLPTQPSPAVFGFLHELVQGMRKAGEDVWTPAAVKAVKTGACDGVWRAVENGISGRVFGEEKEEKEKAERKIMQLDVRPVTRQGSVSSQSGSIRAGVEKKTEVETTTKLEAEKEKEPEMVVTEDKPVLNGEKDNKAEEKSEDKTEKEEQPENTDSAERTKSPAPVLDTDPVESASPGESGEPAVASEEPASEPTPTPRITRDWVLQLLFDALYLDEALHRKRRRGAPSVSLNGSSSSVTSLVGKVDSVIGAKLALDEELRMRLEGAASEYWKRTCLLFALL
ncbi:hypothetical protein FPQ18DRAFT_336332, partial [Pyronema domesticum]